MFFRRKEDKEKLKEMISNPADLHNYSFGDVLTVKEILQKALLIKGVSEAFLIGKDGLIISSAGNNRHLMEGLGSVICTNLEHFKEIADETGLGQLQGFELNLKTGKVFYGIITEKLFYVVIGNNESHQDKVSFLMDGYKPAIKKFLSNY